MDSPVTTDTATTGGSHVSRVWLWAAVVVILLSVGGYIYYQQWTINKKNTQIATLTGEKSAVEEEKQTLVTTVNEITSTIDEVSAKLQDVRKRQVIITDLITRSGEMTVKDRILDDISAIELQLTSDRRDIDDLSAKMQQAGIRIKSLESMVTQLRMEIDENVQAMADLRSIIDKKDEVIRTTENSLRETESTLGVVRNELVVTNQELMETRDDLTEERNTAYYIVGTKDELKLNNIIDEQGLFFQKKSLNLAKDIDENDFNRIDITKVIEFTFNTEAKNLKVIPERSDNSFRIEAVSENQTVLRVTDPEKFWKIKYMAVIVKG